MIVVQKGIPVPVSRKHKYPFKHMDVGDSFIVPVKDRAAASAYASMAKKTTGYRFTSSRDGDNVRFWRIS